MNDKKYAILIGEVIVNICLKNKISINTSKLMKFLFLIQSYHLKIYKENIFDNKVYATECGPFIPEVYDYFKCGILGFESKYDTSIILKDSHEKITNIVLCKYGKYTPNELIEITKKDWLYNYCTNIEEKTITKKLNYKW